MASGLSAWHLTLSSGEFSRRTVLFIFNGQTLHSYPTALRIIRRFDAKLPVFDGGLGKHPDAKNPKDEDASGSRADQRGLRG
jgi:hypothetical protein